MMARAVFQHTRADPAVASVIMSSEFTSVKQWSVEKTASARAVEPALGPLWSVSLHEDIIVGFRFTCVRDRELFVSVDATGAELRQS